MDIRWKNTAKVWALLEGKKRWLLAFIAAVSSYFVFKNLFCIYRWTYSEVVWREGLKADFLIGITIFILLNEILEYIYRRWIPKEESFYEEWEREWKKQQGVLLVLGIILAAAAMTFFEYIRDQRNMGYVSNYAMGYFMIASAVILYGLCQVCIISFMKRRLNMLMKRMNKINKESLEKAIEIERQSIEKANRSEQLKIDLISNVSHDLKTPLTSIVGYLELLKMEELNPAADDYVNVISEKTEKLKEMIESLFSLAKASSGNMSFCYENIELNMLIEQIFADMEDRIDESQLQFVKLLTPEDTHFVSDNIHIYRICQNLIENALKYSAKGTRVFVKTGIRNDERGEKVKVEIVNTAAYYMDFTKEDIVERFARGDKARTSEGNGLGLAIVSTYANALGGEFDIEIDCDQFKAKLEFPKNVTNRGE